MASGLFRLLAIVFEDSVYEKNFDLIGHSRDDRDRFARERGLIHIYG